MKNSGGSSKQPSRRLLDHRISYFWLLSRREHFERIPAPLGLGREAVQLTTQRQPLPDVLRGRGKLRPQSGDSVFAKTQSLLEARREGDATDAFETQCSYEQVVFVRIERLLGEV